MQQKVKYLIIGQGIVGTWMSYFLHARGISFRIINDMQTQAATSVASGVINPVTGRRIVQTWMIETILPFAIESYQSFEKKMRVAIFKKAPAILLHPSEQMKESFDYRLTHENVYLFKNEAAEMDPFFNAPFGTGAIDECYWIDLNKMLLIWSEKLKIDGNYIEAHFDTQDLTLHEKGISWKNIDADKILFCDGIHSLDHPFFNTLPFAPNKGEALIIKVPGLPTNHIYKSKISVIPWKEDLFWVGSSYEWSFENEQPSSLFKEKMIAALDMYLKLPYQVVDHITGVRPANIDRRPFIGLHPNHLQIGICNGMGTKGCSLAPYFANQLIDHMEQGAAIEPEASLNRFNNLFNS